jgi:hypothetical protein
MQTFSMHKPNKGVNFVGGSPRNPKRIIQPKQVVIATALSLLLTTMTTVHAQSSGGGSQGGPPNGGSQGGGGAGQVPLPSISGYKTTQTTPIKVTLTGPFATTMSFLLPNYYAYSVAVPLTVNGINYMDASLAMEGPITFKFEWLPTASNPNPPNELRLLKTVSATAKANGDRIDSVAVSASTGESKNSYYYKVGPYVDPATGRRVAEHIVQSQSLIRKVGSFANPLTSFEISASPSAFTSGYVGTETVVHPYYGIFTRKGNVISSPVSIGAGVKEDTRTVAIYRAWAVNETVDSEGNTHGHTTYSYVNKNVKSGDFYIGDIENPNWQPFNSQYNGFWNFGNTSSPPTEVSWSWSPQYSGATKYTNSWLIPYGNQNNYNGSFIGHTQGDSGEKVMTYTATDPADGATATAKYYLTIHDPIEDKGAPQTEVIADNWQAAASPAVFNYSTTAYVTTPPAYLEYAISHTIGINFGGDIHLTGHKLSDIGVSANYSISFTYNAGQTSFSIELPPRTYSYLEVADMYKRYWGKVNKWEPSGAFNEASYDFKVPETPGYTIRMHPPIPISTGGGNTGT